jgi:hypothetical protein
MEPVVAVFTVLAAFAVLALSSWRWGADSRDGRDGRWGAQPRRSDAPSSAPLVDSRARVGRVVAALRKFLTEQAELHERLALMNRPWEERFVHWAGDPEHPHLHGQIPPPQDGRRRSVTRGGWCPGLARERRQFCCDDEVREDVRGW